MIQGSLIRGSLSFPMKCSNRKLRILGGRLDVLHVQALGMACAMHYIIITISIMLAMIEYMHGIPAYAYIYIYTYIYIYIYI